MHSRAARRVALLLAVLLAACGGDSGDDPLSQGRSVYGNICSACHGDGGQGGVGPALSSVMETWPSCADHVEWIRLGSEGWREAHGDTYGATDKPVEGGMPPLGGALTDDEIAKVAAFERINHGGGDPAAVLEDCGLTSAE